MSEIGDKMVDLATTTIGLGANPYAPDKMEGYAALIADGETAAMKRSMVTMSGCALTVRGLWRMLGMRDPRLEAPYRIGTAISLLLEMAREADAWHLAAEYVSGEARPDPGDVALLQGPEHVFTLGRIVDASGTEQERWASIDGGQRDSAGREIILAKSRVCVVDDAKGVWLDGRALAGWISLEGVWAKFGSGA